MYTVIPFTKPSKCIRHMWLSALHRMGAQIKPYRKVTELITNSILCLMLKCQQQTLCPVLLHFFKLKSAIHNTGKTFSFNSDCFYIWQYRFQKRILPNNFSICFIMFLSKKMAHFFLNFSCLIAFIGRLCGIGYCSKFKENQE